MCRYVIRNDPYIPTYTWHDLPQKEWSTESKSRHTQYLHRSLSDVGIRFIRVSFMIYELSK